MSMTRQAILVVTSAKTTGETLQNLLGTEQPLRTSPSAREAIADAQAEKPALVLLDMALPGLDVAEFCSAWKRDSRLSIAPILLLSPTEAAGIAGIGQGANDFLTTPVQPVIAKTRIRNYLDLGKCIEALKRFSLIDGVTGIANRRRFDEFLTLEWRRNLRNRTPLSIVLMDIDHFRNYNDHYGKATGENCLQQIASAFHEATQRPGDLVALYSKAGFACVLPETDTLGAVSVAERMRAELATLAIPNAASTTAPVVTMSVGAATRIPVVDSEPEDLIALAERSLGEAKRAGRNRVAFGN